MSVMVESLVDGKKYKLVLRNSVYKVLCNGREVFSGTYDKCFKYIDNKKKEGN